MREAERIYREILEASPHQRDALHLRGVVAHQLGNDDEAIRSIRQALQVDPTQATFHNSLGAVHQSLGELAEAVACYRQSIMLDIEPELSERRVIGWVLYCLAVVAFMLLLKNFL